MIDRIGQAETMGEKRGGAKGCKVCQIPCLAPRSLLVIMELGAFWAGRRSNSPDRTRTHKRQIANLGGERWRNKQATRFPN